MKLRRQVVSRNIVDNAVNENIKNKTYKDILNSKNPTLVLKDAVRRMLKKGPLSRKQLKNLYIYSSEKHPHTANNPVTIEHNN